MIIEQKIKELSALDANKFLFYLYLDYAIIAGAIALHLVYANFIVYIISIIIIATRQQAIGILSHDVVHYRFLNNKKLADMIGNIFMTWPLYFTIPGYRSLHLRHHRKINTENDPDWVRRKGKSDWVYPMSKVKLYTMLLMDITGLNLYQNIQKLFLPKSDKKLKEDFQKVDKSYYFGMAAFYLTCILIISAYNIWFEYLIYWVIPYFTFFKFIKRLRAVGEHFGIPDKEVMEVTRTTMVNPLEAFLFSQHHINYHVEHHRYAGVPFYNLPKLHKFLIEVGELEKMGHITRKGYLFGILTELTKECALNKHA